MKKSQKLSNRSPVLHYMTHNTKKIFLWCGIVLVVCIVFDFSPYGGKNMQMYAKWIGCGHRPLLVDYGGMFGASQQTYSSAPNFNGSGFEQGPPFFCTVEEAERAGYAKK